MASDKKHLRQRGDVWWLHYRIPNQFKLLPECISEYFYVWGFDEHGYCNEQTPFGNYHLFACRVTKQSDYFGEYTTFKFVNTCIYADKLASESEAHLVFLPLVNNKPTTMSHLP